MTPRRRAALAFARKMIRNQIDREGVYDPQADYVMPGRNLLQYLVHAYEVGGSLIEALIPSKPNPSRPKSFKVSATGAEGRPS